MKLHKLDWKSLLLGDHSYLDMTDECYFTDEYECHHQRGIKPLILSLKRGHQPVIQDLARQLTSALPHEWARAYTFVPMPPSSGLSSPLKSLVWRLPVGDVRNLLAQGRCTLASHNGWRPTPLQRAQLITLNELQVDPEPRTVVIVDDVLATGSHFRAAKMLVRVRWPRMRVIGLFLARVCSRRSGSCHFETADHGNDQTCEVDPRRTDSMIVRPFHCLEIDTIDQVHKGHHSR